MSEAEQVSEADPLTTKRIRSALGKRNGGSTMPSNQRRVDKFGRAYKGSQLQVQIYVNRRRRELDGEVLKALPSLAVHRPRLYWVSPIEDRSFREYHDGDFLRAIGLSELAPLLKEFWPARGAHWDALAIVERGARDTGVLLVEAKSYADELRGGGMRASAAASKSKIRRAIKATQDWLTVPEEKRDSWYAELYQTGNRLAHLYWLRQVADIDAWLLHLLFVNDPTLGARQRTSKKEWDTTAKPMEQALGLDQGFVPHFGHGSLPGRKREELTRRP